MRTGKQSVSGKSPDQVARLLQTYLDRGNQPKPSWSEFLRQENASWVIDKEALANRMWNVANERAAYLEVA